MGWPLPKASDPNLSIHSFFCTTSYAPLSTKGASVGRDVVITIGIVVLVSSAWGWACIPFGARRHIGAMPAFLAGAVLWPLGLALLVVTERLARALHARSADHEARVVPSADGLVGATPHG